VADAHGIPVLQPMKIRNDEFYDRIRACALDLGVVAAFGRILPDALLAIPRLGMINVHASILTKYRGAAPIQRAVLAGEQETGVSIMRVVTELDAGATFAVARMAIGPDETSGEVEARLAQVGADALLPVVEDLAGGRATETPQDPAQATFAPKVTKDESEIDWSMPAAVIHDKVRGLQPWPLASTRVSGVRHVLRRTRAAGSGPLTLPQDAQRGSVSVPLPGAVLRASGDDLVVACGGGTEIRILEIQPEGRRTMTAREFLAGRRLTTTDRFGP
jgi:methionyl-tRNA formyltransferase